MSKEGSPIEYVSLKHGPISHETHVRFQAGKVDPISAARNALPSRVQGYLSMEEIKRSPQTDPHTRERMDESQRLVMADFTEEDTNRFHAYNNLLTQHLKGDPRGH